MNLSDFMRLPSEEKEATFDRAIRNADVQQRLTIAEHKIKLLEEQVDKIIRNNVSRS